MSEMDAEGAREHSMPETTIDEDEKSYKMTSVQQIKTYTKAKAADRHIERFFCRLEEGRKVGN